MTTLQLHSLIGAERALRKRLVGGLLMACALAATGCASISNPVADAIPARRIPTEYLARAKADYQQIPLPTLQQPQPDAYRIAKGDTLGIYIETILGDKNQPLPVNVNFRPLDQGDLPPAIGYPIPVRDDGTLPLPYIKPLKVSGLTVDEAEDMVRKAYLEGENPILVKGRERILVSLYRKRQIQVNVFRQESPQVSLTAGVQSSSRRSESRVIDLPAYQNDVLTALVKSGGLPGLDAINEVKVQRNMKDEGTRVIRIPLRIREGEPIPFTPQDILLENGDTIFIEARDTEYYYVGGLMVPKQFTLPRDYDLKVTDALAIAGGPYLNGGFNQNNQQGNVIANGIGSPSPSQMTILRQTKNYGLIKINVNINRAVNDPRENLLVMSGDTLILQETPGEALTRYASSTFRFSFFSRFIRGENTTGSISTSLP